MDRRRRACGNCEKAERSWRGLFQASVGIRVLCGFPSEASVSTGLGFSFFFAPFFFLGVFDKKILRQDRLGTTIAPSVDLRHPPFFVSLGGLPLAEVDRRRRLI